MNFKRISFTIPYAGNFYDFTMLNTLSALSIGEPSADSASSRWIIMGFSKIQNLHKENLKTMSLGFRMTPYNQPSGQPYAG